MRNRTTMLVLSLCVVFGLSGTAQAQSGHSHGSGNGHSHQNGNVYVHPYVRSDGTPVQGHYRSHPDGDFTNNWTTRGNVNPYTGVAGTRTQAQDSIGMYNGSASRASPAYGVGSGFPPYAATVGPGVLLLPGKEGVTGPPNNIRPTFQESTSIGQTAELSGRSAAAPFVAAPSTPIPPVPAVHLSPSPSITGQIIAGRHDRTPSLDFQNSDRHYRPN